MNARHFLFPFLTILFWGCGKTLDYDKPDSSEKTESLVIELSSPGTLGSYIDESNRLRISELKLAGPLNGSDLLLLREMAGANKYGESTKGSLEMIDLQNAWFEAGGPAFFIYVDSEGAETPILSSSGGIPELAFAYCQKLKTIFLPKSIDSIGYNAFYKCANLAACSIPESVSSIGRSAFCECSSLQEIVLPTKVDIIQDYTFKGCSSLKRVDSSGHITKIGYASFGECPQLETLGGSGFSFVQSIDSYAFFGCSSLDKALFPKGQKNIPYACFYGCTNITSFDFSKIEVIEGYAFTNSGLTSVKFSEGLVSIEDMAFASTKVKTIVGHSPLTGELVLPKTLSYMGYGAFFMSGITKVLVQSDITINPDIEGLSYSHFNCPVLESVSIAEGVEFLELAFRSSKLTNVKLPSTLKRIGYFNLFYWAAFTFSGCNSLESIDLPDSVEILGSGVFLDCESLKQISLPSNLKELESYAFSGCTALKTVDITANLDVISQGLFQDCTSLESVSLPSSITSIGREAFKGCESLKTVIIPASVNSIGKECFQNCTSLISISIPPSVAELQENTFAGCTSLSSIKISGSLTSIGDECFSKCYSLSGIELPSSLTKLGNYVFYHCSSMETIVIHDGVEVLGPHSFDNCRSLKVISLPTSIKDIQDECFSSCIHLQEISVVASTPPMVKANAFNTTPISSATLFVPQSSINKYKSSVVWQDFGTISSLH